MNAAPRRTPVSGAVEAIYIAPQGGAAMQPVTEIHAIVGRGLAGDRYLERTGYWSGMDECEVTLIEGEGLDRIEGESGIGVSRGEHRRNIVTRGVRLAQLAGKRFAVGEAVLSYDRPRPPCAYIQSITQPGMTRALAQDGRGGICARVVRAGVIRPGDRIEVVEAAGAATIR